MTEWLNPFINHAQIPAYSYNAATGNNFLGHAGGNIATLTLLLAAMTKHEWVCRYAFSSAGIAPGDKHVGSVAGNRTLC